jgi:fucose permease
MLFFAFAKDRFDRRVIMVVGIWIEVIGLMIIGPVLPYSGWGWTAAGMFIMGMGSALAYLPTLPFMIANS